MYRWLEEESETILIGCLHRISFDEKQKQKHSN